MQSPGPVPCSAGPSPVVADDAVRVTVRRDPVNHVRVDPCAAPVVHFSSVSRPRVQDPLEPGQPAFTAFTRVQWHPQAPRNLETKPSEVVQRWATYAKGALCRNKGRL